MDRNSATQELPSTGYPRAINAQLDAEPGTTITGTIEGFDQGPSAFGKDVVIATLELEDGEVVSLWLSATVLVSSFARLKPTVGERVRVTFLGSRQGASATYKAYKVEAPDRPPFEPDWDSLGGDDEAEDG
jgi:hypothetical protein